jgi:hypothetical protein
VYHSNHLKNSNIFNGTLLINISFRPNPIQLLVLHYRTNKWPKGDPNRYFLDYRISKSISSSILSSFPFESNRIIDRNRSTSMSGFSDDLHRNRCDPDGSPGGFCYAKLLSICLGDPNRTRTSTKRLGTMVMEVKLGPFERF